MDSAKLSSGRQIYIGENLFTIPALTNEKPKLIGSKCQDCGETVFPAKKRCPNCSSDNIEQALLGPRGTLYSFTVVYQSPPVGYRGPVPYGIVKVEMPDGLRITGYSPESNPDNLTPGREMELSVEKLFLDENGNEVTGFIFKPVLNGDR